MQYVIGIDPGFSGAIATLSTTGEVVEVSDMPIIKAKKDELDTQTIKDILSRFDVIHVYIEKAQAFPKQGCVSMFRYGKASGILEGIIIGLDIPYSLIAPQTWKKEIMRDMGKEKTASILRVNMLFPDLNIGNRKKDHGKADAILIAEYGRRVENILKIKEVIHNLI